MDGHDGQAASIGTFAEVSLASIDEDERANRAGHAHHIEELAASIEENGLLQPIVLERTSQGDRARFRLIAGARRLRALRLLNRATAAALVVDPITDSARLALGIIENVQRDNLTGAERSRSLLALRDMVGGSTKTAAELIGIHPASFRRAVRHGRPASSAPWPGSASGSRCRRSTV